MGRVAWRATGYGVTESDTTERLNSNTVQAQPWEAAGWSSSGLLHSAQAKYFMNIISLSLLWSNVSSCLSCRWGPWDSEKLHVGGFSGEKVAGVGAQLCINPHSSSYLKVLVTQSCPTLCDPMDCGLPGSSVHGIFQARILEWAAISSFPITPFSWVHKPPVRPCNKGFKRIITWNSQFG